MGKEKRKPPHYSVCTRIAVSQIHGIGVFAITRIKKGTPIFYGDEKTKTELIPKKKIKNLPKGIQKLYADFCPLNKGIYTCPVNFNLLTVSWYLNESKTPNVGCNSDYIFYALRNIKKGEELTADYSKYSE